MGEEEDEEERGRKNVAGSNVRLRKEWVHGDVLYDGPGFLPCDLLFWHPGKPARQPRSLFANNSGGRGFISMATA